MTRSLLAVSSYNKVVSSPQHFKDLIRLRRTTEWPRSSLDSESTAAKETPEIEPLPFTLSHECCISVVQKLTLFLLSMDFTCHADLLLFVCKVRRRPLTHHIVSGAHPHSKTLCKLFRSLLGSPVPPDPQSTCVRWCLNSRWNVSSSCLWGLNSTGGTFPGEVHGLSIRWHVCCRTSWQVGLTFHFTLLIFVQPVYIDIPSNLGGRVKYNHHNVQLPKHPLHMTLMFLHVWVCGGLRRLRWGGLLLAASMPGTGRSWRAW